MKRKNKKIIVISVIVGLILLGLFTIGYFLLKDLRQEKVLKDEVEKLSKIDVAEGRYNTPAEAGEAMKIGAYAVISGTAITRPRVITQWFVAEIDKVINKK